MSTTYWGHQSYVYVLESNGFYKIGFSDKPEARVRRLQTGSPAPIRLVHCLRTPFFREIEQLLHTRFSSQRISGEWFELFDDDLRYIREMDARGWDKAEQEQHEADERERVEHPERLRELIERVQRTFGSA